MIPPRVITDRRRAETVADPGGGFASRVSGHVRPRDPGRMTIDDVSQAVEKSGGDLSWFPPGFRQCGPKRLWLRTLLMMLDYDRGRALCGC